MSNDGYIGDEFLHLISGDDTGGLTATTIPAWMRTRADATQKEYFYALTAPDDQGRFWGSIMGGDGAAGNVTNVQMQLVNPPGAG